MKPVSPAIDQNSRFPKTDCNFQSVEMSAYGAPCAESNSFRVFRAYFDKEAPKDFLSEAAVFGVIMLTAAIPLLNGIEAITALIIGI